MSEGKQYKVINYRPGITLRCALLSHTHKIFTFHLDVEALYPCNRLKFQKNIYLLKLNHFQVLYTNRINNNFSPLTSLKPSFQNLI